MEKSCFNRATTLPWFLNTLFIASYNSSAVVVILLSIAYSKKRNLPFRIERAEDVVYTSRRRFPWVLFVSIISRTAYDAFDRWIQNREKLFCWSTSKLLTKCLRDLNLHYRNVTNVDDDSACCLSISSYCSLLWRHFFRLFSLSPHPPSKTTFGLIWFANLFFRPWIHCCRRFASFNLDDVFCVQ